MSIVINSAAKVVCKNCNKRHAISPEDFGEPSKETIKQSMGSETKYSWLCETKCCYCGNGMNIAIDAFEYPKGDINYTNHHLGGCIFFKEPTFEIKGEPVISEKVESDVSDISENAREILIQQRQEYREKLEAAKEELNRVFWENQQDFIAKAIPYKVGDVIEITGDKRKHKRMAVYEIIINWMVDYPMVALYGWYLDKNNTPVKWEANGVYVYGVDEIGCTIKLSENQENKPVPAKFKTVD